MYNYDLYPSGADSSFAAVGAFGIIALIIAICGSIVLYCTFLSKNNEKKYKGFLGWLYDFLTFKTFSLEAILKFLYLFVAIYITFASFALISTSFIGFLLMLVFGNLFARIIFEGSLILILIYKNIVEINKKTK